MSIENHKVFEKSLRNLCLDPLDAIEKTTACGISYLKFQTACFYSFNSLARIPPLFFLVEIFRI